MIKKQIPGIPDTTPDNTIKIAKMVKNGVPPQDAINSVLKKRKPMSDQTNVPRKRVKNEPETLSEIWYDTFGSSLGSFPSYTERERFEKIRKHYRKKLKKNIRKAIKYYKRYVDELSLYRKYEVDDFWENAKLPNYLNKDNIPFFIKRWMKKYKITRYVNYFLDFFSLDDDQKERFWRDFRLKTPITKQSIYDQIKAAVTYITEDEQRIKSLNDDDMDPIFDDDGDLTEVQESDTDDPMNVQNKYTNSVTDQFRSLSLRF